MKILQFLQEDNGTFSNARLLAFMSVACFITDWILHIIRSLDFNPSWTIIGLVLGVVGAKVTQKFAENNKETTIDTK